MTTTINLNLNDLHLFHFKGLDTPWLTTEDFDDEYRYLKEMDVPTEKLFIQVDIQDYLEDIAGIYVDTLTAVLPGTLSVGAIDMTFPSITLAWTTNLPKETADKRITTLKADLISYVENQPVYQKGYHIPLAPEASHMYVDSLVRDYNYNLNGSEPLAQHFTYVNTLNNKTYDYKELMEETF